MVLFLVAAVALVLVAFGIGVAVGVQEEHARLVPTPTPVEISGEPALRGMAVPQSPPTVSPALRPTAAPQSVAGAPQPTGPSAARTAESSPAPVIAAPEPEPVAIRPRATAAPASGHWVQVGAFSLQPSAERARREVLEAGYAPVQVVVELGEDGKYRVRVGPFPDQESAGRVAARLRARGFAGAFTVSE